MKKTTVLASGVAITLLLAVPLRSKEAAPSAEEVTLLSELRSFNQTMREIAGLLRENLEKQEVDVLLKRLELGMQKLAPVEKELRSVRSQKENVEENHRSMAAMFEMQEGREIEEGAGLDESAAAQMKKEFEVQLDLLKDTDWKLEQRIIELENELKRRQEGIQVLEEKIDERLGLR